MNQTLLVDVHITTLLKQFWSGTGESRSFCFYGPEHIGKKTLALWFVQGAFCSNPHNAPCGVCTPCIQIQQDIHPDVRVLPDNNERISIEDIRSYTSWLHQRSLWAHGKWFVLPAIDRLSLEAQNALLKLLEEPPESTKIITTTHQLGVILATLKSRMLMVRMRDHTSQQLKQYMNDVDHTVVSDAIIQAAQGRIGKLYELIHDDKIVEAFETESIQAIAFLSSSAQERWKAWNDSVSVNTHATDGWLKTLASALHHSLQQDKSHQQYYWFYSMLRIAHTMPEHQRQKSIFKQWCCHWPSLK